MRPSRTNTTSRIIAPVGPRPMRLETAQLPAKAAPKTSALIRIAALTTVRTWIQTILRSLLRLLMATGPGGGGNVPETEGSIKAYFLRLSLGFLTFSSLRRHDRRTEPGPDHAMPLRGS